jgi:hypothetical protein
MNRYQPKENKYNLSLNRNGGWNWAGLLTLYDTRNLKTR